ncbi:MAG TPA: GNAT family N-acetyltransferase, partial [Longimicrobium sp.]|nr:GNAT family N-acetyltransferase [Longimicrobium sp.]
ALTNDPDWLRHIGDRGIRTADDARAYIENIRSSYARHGHGLWTVELRENRAAIGSCGLVTRDWLEHSDLGYAFLADYRGRGYAREAAAATLEHARDALGMTHLQAIVTPENRDSIQLLTKIGMSLERMATPPGGATELCVYGCDLSAELSSG